MKCLLRKLGVAIGQMPRSGEAIATLTVDPTFANASRKYFQSKNGKLVESRSSSTSYDEDKAEALLRDSEQLVRVT